MSKQIALNTHPKQDEGSHSQTIFTGNKPNIADDKSKNVEGYKQTKTDSQRYLNDYKIDTGRE